MKHFLVYPLLLAGLLMSCQRTPIFTIDGVIANAEEETLYLEHTALL